MSKEVQTEPTLAVTVIPLGRKTANGNVYSLDLFQNPPLPCLVQIYDGKQAQDYVDLSQVVGIMDNLREETTPGGLQALVGDFHHLNVPLARSLEAMLDHGIQCTPIGFGNRAEDGTISNYTLVGFGITSTGLSKTAIPA